MESRDFLWHLINNKNFKNKSAWILVMFMNVDSSLQSSDSTSPSSSVATSPVDPEVKMEEIRQTVRRLEVGQGRRGHWPRRVARYEPLDRGTGRQRAVACSDGLAKPCTLHQLRYGQNSVIVFQNNRISYFSAVFFLFLFWCDHPFN